MKIIKIAVIGLGYVGLPLAQLFATKYGVIGFDINSQRISDLRSCIDTTMAVSSGDLKLVTVSTRTNAPGLYYTNDVDELRECNYFIVTVPTPVDKTNRPDLSHLRKASETVGKLLKQGDIVIYESTVYPGVTEEECVPLLEKVSGLSFNKDFYVGYSPERINPGDKEHTIDKIVKVTSGSTPEIGRKVDKLYKSVIKAGTFLVSSIRIAEAAKVIENSQRDINIAFVNELSKIFNLMQIDTREVLRAAGTKWNFMSFKPGLVGGHCIGVDPYYLAQKAQEYGYHPEIILAGRRLNDGMGKYVADEVIKLMVQGEIKIKGSKILVLGIAFKENCPDVRNSKAIDVIKNLEGYGIQVVVHDPWVFNKQVEEEYHLDLEDELPVSTFDAIILAVAHNSFLDLDLRSMLVPNGILYDVMGVLNCKVDGRL